MGGTGSQLKKERSYVCSAAQRGADIDRTAPRDLSNLCSKRRDRPTVR